MNTHPGLISFRMDWLELLAVQGTLKSLLQHYSPKASILWHSAFFIVQLSHPYMTTAKTIALTRQTFVAKVMSLLLNMLSRLVITFMDSNPVSTVNFILRDYFIDTSVWICGCIASNNPFQKMQIGRQLLVYLKAIGKKCILC